MQAAAENRSLQQAIQRNLMRQEECSVVERPDYVKNFEKPKLTEVKCIRGHWYLYHKVSYYDKERKQMRWKSGSIIGKITPEGLVPSKHRKKSAQSETADDTGAQAGCHCETHQTGKK